MSASRSRYVAGTLVLILGLALAASGPASARPGARFVAPAPLQTGEAPGLEATAPALPYLELAEQGVALARRYWRDPRSGWYRERLGDRDRFPLATIWGIVPLFETLDAIDIAAPSAPHRAALETFARGAERYFDASLRPTPGFAPYPGDRGSVRVWFDDNGWWGLAFMDAYQATHRGAYLRQARRAFAFIAAQGWDRAGGGLWWNTSHAYRAGEALASASLLGALLYRETHDPFYLGQVEKFMSWGDAHFLSEYRLYALTDRDPTPTPYVEGTLVEAHEILCLQGLSAACARARELADGSWLRFAERITMGPQFDTIYLHWMLVYASQTGDARWPALAREVAAQAQTNALDGRGLYLSAWDGGPITAHQAQPGMLQTDAATLELFGWLAALRR
jgi:hypothetical protein